MSSEISLINVESSTYVNIPEPLGILQLAANLEKNNFKVKVLDMSVDKTPLKNFFDSKLIGLSFSTPNVVKTKEIIKDIRSYNPNAKIMIGGSHASALPEMALKEIDADIVAKKEADLTIVEIAEEKPLKNILGISYKENNKIIHNQDRPFIENLDILPYPARHLVDMDKYDIHFTWEGLKPAATVFSSRGCFANCIYCASKITWDRIVRFRSAEHVLGEIQELKEKYKRKEILFYDDVFPLKQERLIKICKGLKDLDMSWCCLSRVDTLREDNAKLMADSGCHMVNFGVESGSAKILQNLDKGLGDNQIEAKNKIRKAFDLCHKHGISTKASFMFGSPEETKESIQETIDMIYEIMPDYMWIFSITPIVGTELWKMHKDKGILQENWSLYDQNLYNKYINTSLTYDFVRKKIRNTYINYYLSPKYFLRQIRRGSLKPYKAMFEEFSGTIRYVISGKTRKVEPE
ncbi:MAG: radical SAM protein [Nanoarchaeota archaeon]